MSSGPAALFDLYGTLLSIERSFERGLPRRLGASRRRWAQVLRGTLVTSLAGNEEMVDHILGELGVTVGDGATGERRDALALLERELASIRPLPGALAVLRFLRRRGVSLGLVSNLASPYRQPFEEHGMSELFDAVAFSCDEGRAKPDPELYLGVCRRLGVGPEEAVMVGDSRANDVEAPRRLGMRAIQVTPGPRRDGRLRLIDIGWLSLEGSLEPLLHPGQELRLGGSSGVLASLEPVLDQDQGRYNLVSWGEVELAGGARRRLFFKRFLLPESAWVEELARRLLTEVGVMPCPGGILAGAEPVLWSDEAPGEKLRQPEWSADLAREIGRHGATAYLFANADLRPRNAFVEWESGRPRLVMLDHEHCFFNLALDLSGLGEVRDPRQLDALGDEVDRRVAKRVVTPATMRRTRRAFFGDRMRDADLAQSYREGWLEVHQRAQQKRDALVGIVSERLYREPYIVVGTRAYRRPLAGLDLEDMLERIDRDPGESAQESI